MTVRLDNVAIVVADLDEAVDFFTELGLEFEGRANIEGVWADQTVGLTGVRSEIVVLRTPDGSGRVELTRYEFPPAVEGSALAPNTVGLHRLMFAVDDIDGTIARLQRFGVQLLDRVAQYEQMYRLCYLRGPSGIIVALAQRIG